MNFWTIAILGGVGYWLYKSKADDVTKAAASAKKGVTEVIDTARASIPVLQGFNGLGVTVDVAGRTIQAKADPGITVSKVGWLDSVTNVPGIGPVRNKTLAIGGGAAALAALWYFKLRK